MPTIYESLSSIRILSRSYTFKFLFIAFLGIHIPLIGLIVFIIFNPGQLHTPTILAVTLSMTLAATATTLFVLNGLLSPLRKSRQALQDYLSDRKIPDLPTHFVDEAGVLMQNIQFTITELNDLLEEKKDLTSLLSHDLRIPLRNVITLAGVLQKYRRDEESVKDIARMINDSAEEQVELLESILEILRQDHMFTSANQNVKVNTRDLIEDTIDSFAPAAQQKRISIRKEIAFDGMIEVQPDLFKQVLKNLASNAIKFSYEGSEINFAVYRKNDKTHIEVRDSGMGFEPEVAEMLFERFTKKGRKGTAGEPSTGIGLYLARKIIRHHQGELKAYSKGNGEGSTFSISLSHDMQMN